MQEPLHFSIYFSVMKNFSHIDKSGAFPLSKIWKLGLLGQNNVCHLTVWSAVAKEETFLFCWNLKKSVFNSGTGIKKECNLHYGMWDTTQ